MAMSPVAEKYHCIIDASNVARLGSEKAKIGRLQNAFNKLASINLKFTCIADANLRHLIDNREEYEKMIDESLVIQAPAGSRADTFILRLARELSHECVTSYLMTNDNQLIQMATGDNRIRGIHFIFVPWEEKESMIFDPGLETLQEELKSPKTGCSTHE